VSAGTPESATQPAAVAAPAAAQQSAAVEARGSARAQDADAHEEAGQSSLATRILERIQVHGFVSEGGFISTANEFIGKSSRGSLKFLEVGLNLSVSLTDQLRVGVQFVSRSVGNLSEEIPRLDWAIIDYRYRPWFGVRAGAIKLPLGLYNEFIGVDATRAAILLPQSVYPLRNRDALVSHTGFAVYGDVPLGPAGVLEYQAWLGILAIPRSALELDGASLESVDTKYVTGGQLFYRPIEGLRVGATYLRASLDFNLRLDSGNTQQLIAAGLVAPDYNGKLVVQQSPASFWVASAEYTVGDWLFAFEYSRWFKHQKSSLPLLLPAFEQDEERFYGMLTYRISPHFELGSYYSVTHVNADDRRGRRENFRGKRITAFQRDLAGTLRIDVNDYWLWKLEAHLIDGVGELQSTQNPNPTRLWGMFLIRTTVTF
jgi:hypothetical protein